MKPVHISNSYIQNQRHANVSQKYNVIQASSVGDAMRNNGFALVSLKTGRAVKPENESFQRTLSRYRGPEILPGLFLDLIYDSKHMGRGVDKIFLGIYRMVCSNGLMVGSTFFQAEIRHVGNTYIQLDTSIKTALEQVERLKTWVARMGSVQLTEDQKQDFARQAALLVVPQGASLVTHNLLKTRREEDTGNDAFTVYNRIQENILKGGVVYDIPKENSLEVRRMQARSVKENSAKDLSLNQSLFNLVDKIAA